MIHKHVCGFKSNTKPANYRLAVFNLRLSFHFFYGETLALPMKNDSMENILCLSHNKDFSKQ